MQNHHFCSILFSLFGVCIKIPEHINPGPSHMWNDYKRAIVEAIRTIGNQSKCCQSATRHTFIVHEIKSCATNALGPWEDPGSKTHPTSGLKTVTTSLNDLYKVDLPYLFRANVRPANNKGATVTKEGQAKECMRNKKKKNTESEKEETWPGRKLWTNTTGREINDPLPVQKGGKSLNDFIIMEKKSWS